MSGPFPIVFPAGADAVKFDGEEDYLTRGADLTGNADGQKGLVSFWFKLNGSDGVRMSVYNTEAPLGTFNEIVRLGPSNKWFLRFARAGSGAVEQFRSATAYIADGTWHHAAASWDLAMAGAHHLRIDGVDDLADDVFKIHDVGKTIAYTQDDHSIAAEVNGADPTGEFFDGCLAHLYLNFAEYLDLNVTDNLEKFRTDEGRPADLGADGSEPTGTAPLVYLTGGMPKFLTNAGTGGDFTKNGAPVDCATAP